ncbi:nitroreductase/quinone reductase family protein, partial [Nocardia cyriacigeorgica]|uniref:nitroreductase/quinone reductase family protein n=1 Tax=Nocardia cyriacigeorgica TaxID=135487 RepID=UPI002115591F
HHPAWTGNLLANPEATVVIAGETIPVTATPVPDNAKDAVYIAAGGPLVARYAGRAGDGFICTSGKGMDLYTEKLMPAV